MGPKLLNEKGNITLVYLAIFVMLFSWCILATYRAMETHQAIKTRSKSYLCFKYLTHHTAKYFERMSELNVALRTVYPLTQNPVTAPAAIPVHKSLQAAQLFTRVSYLKKMSVNHYCSLREASFFVINDPYERIPHQDGSVGLRREKWNVYLMANNTLLGSTAGRFIIRGSYVLRSAFRSEYFLEGQELSSAVLPNLKQHFGSPFFSRL